MKEVSEILEISKIFSRSPQQKNKVFESDCEIFEIDKKLYGVSIDEFSEEEDLWKSDDLHKLGRNLALATISDLIVCGCSPKFFVHSIVSPKKSSSFALEISNGVKSVLDEYGCFMLGGDMGESEKWRYTATVIGSFEENKYISRLIPNREQNIFITGHLGGFNFSALTKTSDLEIKKKDIITQSNAGIDTSDGFISSLQILQMINPKISYHIDSKNIPYYEKVLHCNFPKEAFLLGGAGEYEFLFFTDTNILNIPNATKIGIAKPSINSEIYFNDKLVKIPNISSRDFENKKMYIDKILEIVKNVF